MLRVPRERPRPVFPIPRRVLCPTPAVRRKREAGREAVPGGAGRPSGSSKYRAWKGEAMGIMKTDGQIQKDVLDELAWDTRVKATDVGVEVDKGVVTLTGKVPSYGKKVAAREAAHRVTGVLDVVDDVEVHIPSTYERSDTEIAQVMRNAFI